MLLIFTKQSAFFFFLKNLLVLLTVMACELVKYMWKEGQVFLCPGTLPYTIGTPNKPVATLHRDLFAVLGLMHIAWLAPVPYRSEG